MQVQITFLCVSDGRRGSFETSITTHKTTQIILASPQHCTKAILFTDLLFLHACFFILGSPSYKSRAKESPKHMVIYPRGLPFFHCRTTLNSVIIAYYTCADVMITINVASGMTGGAYMSVTVYDMIGSRLCQ
jgi:hypothetical protein